jgi:CRP-like cAMP-binding protein
MNRQDLEAAVAAHPFLIGMTQHHIQLLVDCAMQSHFEQGQIIFREGDTANRFYLIEQGEMVLESSMAGAEPVAIDTVRDGELLGWSWLFAPYVWHFSARSTQPTEAIFFYGTVLREYCERDHGLGFELFKRMSEVMTCRLQSARARLISLYAPIPAW